MIRAGQKDPWSRLEEFEYLMTLDRMSPKRRLKGKNPQRRRACATEVRTSEYFRIGEMTSGIKCF